MASIRRRKPITKMEYQDKLTKLEHDSKQAMVAFSKKTSNIYEEILSLLKSAIEESEKLESEEQLMKALKQNASDYVKTFES